MNSLQWECKQRVVSLAKAINHFFCLSQAMWDSKIIINFLFPLPLCIVDIHISRAFNMKDLGALNYFLEISALQSYFMVLQTTRGHLAV